jgi:hypothetical protein
MMTLALVIIILLETATIYGLIVSDKFRTMWQEIFTAVRKFLKREKKVEAK